MIGPYWRATAGRTLFGAVLLAAPACREPAPAPPGPARAPARVGTCPLPLVRGQSDRTVPARLQLTNGTPERLVVFVDACRSHFRWGALEPGRTAVLRLPGRLYPYRGGMRLHAYSSYPRERYGTYIAPLEDGHVLRFTMTPAGAEGSTEAGDQTDAPPDPATGRDAVPAAPIPDPVDVHRTDSRLAYMTLWSEGRRVSLTWLCRDDDSTVHLAGPGLGEVNVPPSVVVRATGGGAAPLDATWGAGEWELEGSPTPALHGAAAAASRILDLATARPVLEVEARSPAGVAGPWRILTGDVGRAVQGFPCR